MELNHVRLHSQLILHEGMRLAPYDDATGKPVKPGEHYRGKLTVGIGRNLDGNPLTKAEEGFVGHNGRDKPITQEQALYLLNNDISAVCRALNDNTPWWAHLDEIRGRVLVDMCFNMGVSKLLGFKNTLSFVRGGNYASAADNMKKSLWYAQVGIRGVRLEQMMRLGQDWVS